MDRLIDYILWMRDFPISATGFRQADALVLCMLSYFDYSPLFAGDEGELPLSRCRSMLEQGTAQVEIVGRDMGYLDILSAAARSRRYGSLLLGNYVDLLQEEPPLQFSAMTFREEGGESFLAFRGTDSSLAGWEEDFMISFSHTPSQELAVDYARRILSRGGCWRMGGHSKGGNLALYAACALPRSALEQLEQIYLLDAPGLCPEVVGLSCTEGLEEKILKVIPQFSVVGKVFEPKVLHSCIVRSTVSGIMQHSLATWGIDHGDLALAEENDPVSQLLDQAQEKWINSLSREERVIFFREVFEALGSGGARTLEELSAEGINGYKEVNAYLRDHASETTRRILGELPRQLLRGGLLSLHHRRPAGEPAQEQSYPPLRGRSVTEAQQGRRMGGEHPSDTEE